jgi:DNA-binding NarL/FixJ family response regulator
MTRSVLIVDDDAGVRKGLQRLLRTMPHLLVLGEACDGEEAVRLTLERQPSVVLMDIAMPRIDGLEATRRIRLNAPNIRVLIVTADTRADLLQKSFEAGADGFLSKSALADELPRALAAMDAGMRFISPCVE